MRQIRQKSKAYKFFWLLLLTTPCPAALNRVYPTSATAGLRMAVYTDVFSTIYKSTDTVQVSTWTTIGGTWTVIPSDQIIALDMAVRVSSTTWTLQRSTVSISEYTDMVFNEIKTRNINEVLDKDVEQYLVWPSSSAPDATWKGWCSEIINGNLVPVACK